MFLLLILNRKNTGCEGWVKPEIYVILKIIFFAPLFRPSLFKSVVLFLYFKLLGILSSSVSRFKSKYTRGKNNFQDQISFLLTSSIIIILWRSSVLQPYTMTKTWGTKRGMQTNICMYAYVLEKRCTLEGLIERTNKITPCEM